MPVDDEVVARGRLGDDDDGGLLASFSQCGKQAPLRRRVAYAEVFEAAVQLVKLQWLRHWRLGFQYRGDWNWSFAEDWEVWR